MVFWRGTVFRVRLARARRGASVPFGERMRVWGRARLSRFPLSNLPSPFVQNFYPYRIPLFDVPRGRKYGGGVLVLLERNGFLEGAAFRVRLAHVRWGACAHGESNPFFWRPCPRAWGACGPALFREGREFGPTPVRVGGVSMRVVSESSRACRDSTTVRGVRAFG